MAGPIAPDFLGVNLVHLAAGGIGGIVRALTRPEQSWRRRSIGAVVGAFVAGYGTPFAAPIAVSLFSHLGATADTAAGLVGFVLGITGLSLSEGAIRLAERWKRDPKLPPKFPWKGE